MLIDSYTFSYNILVMDIAATLTEWTQKRFRKLYPQLSEELIRTIKVVPCKKDKNVNNKNKAQE